MKTIPCHLCHRPATIKFQNHPGYQETFSYDLYHCSSCNTSFSNPLEADEKLYDLIYTMASQIQGYDRYLDYAKVVLHSNNPLQYLVEAEDMYWAVGQHLANKPKTNKILEVGSGLGYLTYALSKNGYNVLGIDISEQAVSQAKKRYGDLFLCADIHVFSKQAPKTYQTVLLIEVIEHIANVKNFLRSIDNMVAPGGEIIITTPNKSVHIPEVLWETEPPPVHLWWFSGQSMIHLASELNYRVHFVDFTAYNLKYPQKLVQIPYVPTRSPRLDAQGKIYYDSWKSYCKRHVVQGLRKLGLLSMVKKLQRKIRCIQTSPNKQRSTLCAVFTKST